MSAPLSMRAWVSMAFIVREGSITCRGIRIDLGKACTVTCVLTTSSLSSSISLSVGSCSSVSFSCLTLWTFLIGVEKVGQAPLRCPALQHLKHNPFSMQRLRSSGVSRVILTTSTSIASRSWFLGGEEKE